MKTTSLPPPSNIQTLSQNENEFPSKKGSPPSEVKPIKELQEELYAKYNPDVVANVFKHISKYSLTNLPLSEVNRIEIFCNYFDMEGKIVKELKSEDKAVTRVFNRYLFHTREEVSSKLKENYVGEPLTHDNIRRSRKHFETIYNMIPELLKRYNESICHRAFNHFSILPSDTLCGRKDLSSYEQLCSLIDAVFAKEQEISTLINVMPYEALQKNFDVLQRQIKKIKDPYAKFDLEKELILKSGKPQMLPPLVPKSHIEERAQLFSASCNGTKWAEQEGEISPLDQSIHKNINNVFFLKSSVTNSRGENVAVFKTQPNGKAQSGAMEALAYDVSLIFGINSGLVPTKQKTLKGMNGSIQIFQNGLSWSEFSMKSIEEQKKIISKISMRSFLEALIPILVLGNRDVHMENFFFYKKDEGKKNLPKPEDSIEPKENADNKIALSLSNLIAEKTSATQTAFLSEPLPTGASIEAKATPPMDPYDGEYGIVVFDNEFCFQYSNYILTSIRKVKASEAVKPTVYTGVENEEKTKKEKTAFTEPLPKRSIVIDENERKAASLPAELDEEAPLNNSLLPAAKTPSKEEEEVIIRESILPIRCAIMALPQADTLITGEDKVWLQKLVATWPKSFEDFFAYLNSPPGKEKLNHLPYKALDRHQLKAFNDRLQKLINVVSRKEEFTPRDLLIRLFPLYPAFYSLTEMLYPDYTEFAVGAKTAEYLCKKAVKLGKLSQEKADLFLDEVYKCAEK